MSIDFLAELGWRGLKHQVTDEEGLAKHLASGKRSAYAGFDPTADSLTIGNLVPIMLLVHFARAGHTPIVLMGGGTGLIGDPSGKSAERELMTEERVRRNVEAQREIFKRVFANAGVAEPTIVNNIDWLAKLSYLEALRDIGKHFSVNQMIQRDSVRDRLNNREQGISYTEFSYMLLQAYDFVELYQNKDVTLQIGGSDQWGNIVSGVDLIRRMWIRTAQHKAALIDAGNAEQIQSLEEYKRLTETVHLEQDKVAFGLTSPLVTKADGSKFGKTESGAIWLSPQRTTPYAYYQFWLNAADADAVRWLRVFTLLSEPEVLAIEQEHAANPGARAAQRALAVAATKLMHGEAEVARAQAAAAALFSGSPRDIPPTLYADVFAGVPTKTLASATLAAGIPAIDFLLAAGVATSKTQARQLLSENAITVSGLPLGLNDTVTAERHLVHGMYAPVRRGKKNWHLARFE